MKNNLNKLIQEENNIYFLVGITFIISLFRKNIPNFLIDFFKTDLYSIIMLLSISFIGKVNIYLSILLLIFFYFSINIQKLELFSTENKQISTEEKKIEPFVLRKEYFLNTKNEEPINPISNYASGKLNTYSELFG